MKALTCPPDHSTCLEKQQKISQLLFSNETQKDALYDTLITLGSKPNSFDPDQLIPENLVLGCQSDLYLYESYQDNKLFFFAHTEALISSGLARVFIEVYSEESPVTILTCKPTFFSKLSQHLSIGRVNGAEALYLRMKQIATQYLKYSA